MGPRVKPGSQTSFAERLFHNTSNLTKPELQSELKKLEAEATGLSQASKSQLLKHAALQLCQQDGHELPDFRETTADNYAEFFGSISPYYSDGLSIGKLKQVCKEHGIQLNGSENKEQVCFKLMKRAHAEGLTSAAELARNEVVRQDLISKVLTELLQFASPCIVQQVLGFLLEWVDIDSEYCNSTKQITQRLDWLQTLKDLVRDQDPDSKVTELHHRASYDLLSARISTLKQTLKLLEQATKLRLVDKLQLYGYLNRDTFDVYNPEQHPLLVVNMGCSVGSISTAPVGGSSSGSTGSSNSLASVFNLPAEEVDLTYAREAQQQAYKCMMAHYRDKVNRPTARPLQPLLAKAAAEEWQLLRSFLLVCGAAIRASYKLDMGATFVPEDCLRKVNTALGNFRSGVESRNRINHAWGNVPGIIVIPTGVGKSALMYLAPYAILGPQHVTKRVLMVVPRTEIRDQLAKGLSHDARENMLRDGLAAVTDPFLPSFCVLSAASDKRVALTGEVSNPQDAGVVVANIQQLPLEKLQVMFTRDHFDLIIYDEGHHAEATTYKMVREYFCTANVLLLTATPFRSDRRAVEGEVVYEECSIADSIRRRFTKNIVYDPVPVQFVEVLSTVTNRVEELLTGFNNIEEAGSKKKYQEAAAASISVRASIIARTIQRIKMLRAISGYPHQAIAQAYDIEDAKALVQEFNSHPNNKNQTGSILFPAAYIASTQPDAERKDIMDNLRSGRIAIIVHVSVLGEGFDLPSLSVCCLFKTFRSIGPFMQFVGRVVRRIRDRASDDDNTAYVVTHPLLGYQQHWQICLEERQDERSELKPSGSVENIAIGTTTLAPDAQSNAYLRYFVNPRDMPPATYLTAPTYQPSSFPFQNFAANHHTAAPSSYASQSAAAGSRPSSSTPAAAATASTMRTGWASATAPVSTAAATSSSMASTGSGSQAYGSAPVTTHSTAAATTSAGTSHGSGAPAMTTSSGTSLPGSAPAGIHHTAASAASAGAVLPGSARPPAVDTTRMWQQFKQLPTEPTKSGDSATTRMQSFAQQYGVEFRRSNTLVRTKGYLKEALEKKYGRAPS